MSIQRDECPIYDLQNNVRYKGLSQTMKKSGSLSMMVLCATTKSESYMRVLFMYLHKMSPGI